MIKYECIVDAQNYLVDEWGEAGKRVIEETHKVTPFNGDFSKFLSHCICCGGNWGGMYLTGIKKLWPDVYKAIPDDMGVQAYVCIIYTLILCGVDCS